MSAAYRGTDGVSIIAEERRRHSSEEGWTPEHDARHDSGELAAAAACYAMPPLVREEMPVRTGPYGEGIEPCSLHDAEFFIPERLWPWHPTWWKPSHNRIAELAKAGSLIAAEIDRLLGVHQ